MKIEVPVEVMDENCIKCNELDIVVNGCVDLWSGPELVNRVFDISCSHVNLCKRLRKRFEEANANDG